MIELQTLANYQMGINILKSFGVAGQPSVMREFHNRVGGFESERNYENVHASDLTSENKKFCPREISLRIAINDKKRNRFIDTSLAYTFAIGRAVEDLLRNKWLVDLVIGDWTCLSCDNLHLFQRKPDKCVKCSSPLLTHTEIVFESKISGAVCSIDQLVKFPNYEKLVVVEVKTIADKNFRELKAPLSEHRQRTALYLRIIAESSHNMKDFIELDFAKVVYLIKGHGCKTDQLVELEDIHTNITPMKEYTVHRNDTQSKKFHDNAMAVKLYKDEGIMPVGICSLPTDSRARTCPVGKICFSWGMTFPAKK